VCGVRAECRRAQIALFHSYTASVALALDFYSSSFRRLATCSDYPYIRPVVRRILLNMFFIALLVII